MTQTATYPELDEYREFGEEIKETLESQYSLCMLNNDYEGAYTALGKLMAYRLIEPNDKRIEKNNKTYIKGGVDASHRFRLDYRRDPNFVPEWYYGNIEGTRTFKIRSVGHRGKRVEGNYEGGITIPSTEHTVRITFCNTPKQVSNNFEKISQTVKEETGKAFKSEKLLMLCREGVYRTCNIEITSSCISRYAELGEVIVRAKANNEAKVYLRYNSIIENWIPIKDVIKEISTTLSKMMGDETVCQMAFPEEKALERQKNLIDSHK